MKKKLEILVVIGLLFIVTMGVFAPKQNVEATGRPEEECPPQGSNSNITCVWTQHRVTGKCKWIPSHSLHWPWEKVPEGTCPTLPQPTATPVQLTPVTPQPTNQPIQPTDKPDPTAQLTCPRILVKGIVNHVVVFSTIYQLTSPAGTVLTFGDLRVDELVFLSSEEIFLEETNTPVTTFTWVPDSFNELRFRETTNEPTCKIRFLFTP